MESLVARAGWWLAALLVAMVMFVNAADTGFAIHMAIFALAAIVGLVISLRNSDYKLAAAGISWSWIKAVMMTIWSELA